jgi:hypothetical protein
MSSTPGISTLLEAEKEAAKIVAKAKAYRTQRLKDARQEASKETEALKASKAAEFQQFEKVCVCVCVCACVGVVRVLLVLRMLGGGDGWVRQMSPWRLQCVHPDLTLHHTLHHTHTHTHTPCQTHGANEQVFAKVDADTVAKIKDIQASFATNKASVVDKLIANVVKVTPHPHINTTL